MINFATCFTSGKSPWVRDIPKMQSQTQLSPHPRPLILRVPPPSALPYTKILAHPSLGKSNQQVSSVFNIDFLFAVKPCRVSRRQTHQRGNTWRYCIANSQSPQSQQLLQAILKSYLCMMDFLLSPRLHSQSPLEALVPVL